VGGGGLVSIEGPEFEAFAEKVGLGTREHAELIARANRPGHKVRPFSWSGNNVEGTVKKVIREGKEMSIELDIGGETRSFSLHEIARYQALDVLCKKLETMGLTEEAKALREDHPKFNFFTSNEKIFTTEQRLKAARRLAELPPKERAAYLESKQQKTERLFKLIDELKGKGFIKQAEVLRNLENRFSDIDGTLISTIDAKLEYAEQFLKMSPQDRIRYLNSQDLQGDNHAIKEFNGQFALAVSVPELVQRGVTAYDAVMELHRISMDGWDQTKDYAREDTGKNIGGRFRRPGEEVSVGDHQPPFSKAIPELMRRFSGTLEKLIKEIKESNTGSPAERMKNAVAVAAWAHQKLVEIHPFLGGNGRTARVFFEYVVQRIVGNDASMPADFHRFIPVEARENGEQSISSAFCDLVATAQSRRYTTHENSDAYQVKIEAERLLSEEFQKVSLEEILGNGDYTEWFGKLQSSEHDSLPIQRFANREVFGALFEFEALKRNIQLDAKQKEAFVEALYSVPDMMGFLIRSPERGEMLQSLLEGVSQSFPVPENVQRAWLDFIAIYNSLL
jgi:hypothetical protein